MEREFRRALTGLNPAQGKAVETIHGPVLVIAGPGTGKTELLALRVANILKKDSTILPGNILALAFTNSASNNMLERLIKYIGQDAYHVAIHTFNSFGAYVMNAYSEYFYQWREAKTADELTTHNILEKILEKLPGGHPLASRSTDGAFYAQTQIRNLIGDAKRAGLSPEDIAQVLAENRHTYERLIPIFRRLWPEKMSDKNAIATISKLVNQIGALKPAKTQVEVIVPLHQMIIESIERASEDSEVSEKGKTKPFTAWKNQWLERDEDNQLIFVGQRHIERLLAAAEVYKEYQEQLQEQGLADFNDQIMWVIEAMEQHPELRYNLQERFQYIMVDEFQDTNRSQLLMTKYLADAPVHEGQPNILAVGDDDQAIYRFQGADIGNVSLFEQIYRDPLLIALGVNYRSNRDIIASSRQISAQIRVSLEKEKLISKKLEATVAKLGKGVVLNEFEKEIAHHVFIAKEVKRLIKAGSRGSEIAILARERAQLDALVPYLNEQQIPINYERRENVLTQPRIINLLTMLRLIYALKQQDFERANELFAKVLSEPMWQIEPIDIWQIAAAAHKEQKFWLEIISEQKSGKCKEIANFFIRLGYGNATMPLEQVLNELIGTDNLGPQNEQEEEIEVEQNSYFSPFKQYYFGQAILKGKPGEYLRLLSQLATLRRHLRNFAADTPRTFYVKDLIELVDAYARGGMVMLDQGQAVEDDDAVPLMTVHKAKGLEFDSVFVAGVQNDVWTTSTSRGRFAYPANLRTIRPSDNQDDDSLRLLYVAMTRARQSLYLNYFKQDEEGKPKHPYGPLLAIDIKPTKPRVTHKPRALVRQYESRLTAGLRRVSSKELEPFFANQLKNYRLSVTHLNNFTDVSIGGPSYFFEHNLLHFPAAKYPMMFYSRAIHTALSRAHNEVTAGRRLRRAAIIKQFVKDISREALSEKDKQLYAQRGTKALSAIFAKMPGLFKKNVQVDYGFGGQGVAVGDARLSGRVDLLDLDKKQRSLAVIDYKLGSSVAKWQLPPSAPQLQRIRLHRYRNQLLFYKILVDGARNFGQQGWKAEKGIIVFVEPYRGKIRTLELTYEQEEIDRFKRLILAVWGRIQKLDFPDTSHYDPTIKGVLAFEEDLIG